MAHYVSNQNRQRTINQPHQKVVNGTSQSRRSWLRKAAIRASGFALLFFVFAGCTKEQWDDITDKVPGGGLGSEPDIWYNLRVTYKDKDGNTGEGFLGRIDRMKNTAYWEYIKIGDKSKFKVQRGENGFDYWQFNDGLWLTLSYYGWAYRSVEGARVGWKIIDGKLYTNYSRWQNYPLGCRWDGGELLSDLNGNTSRSPLAYYVGVDLGDDKVLTSCELWPAARDSD